MEKNDTWITPTLTDLGNAEELVKSVDSPGSGDASFPINLQSA